MVDVHYKRFAMLNHRKREFRGRSRPSYDLHQPRLHPLRQRSRLSRTRNHGPASVKKTQQSDALKSSSLLYVIERTFVSTLVYLIIELLEYVRSRKISIAFKTLTLNIGPITLQGPHHVAQKSMMISLWPALFSKSSSSSWKGMNQQTTAKAMKGHRVFQTNKKQKLNRSNHFVMYQLTWLID